MHRYTKEGGFRLHWERFGFNRLPEILSKAILLFVASGALIQSHAELPLLNFIKDKREKQEFYQLTQPLEKFHELQFFKGQCRKNVPRILTSYLIPRNNNKDSLRVMKKRNKTEVFTFEGKLPRNKKVAEIFSLLRMMAKRSELAKVFIEVLQHSPYPIYIKSSANSSNFLNLTVNGEYHHNNAYAALVLESELYFVERVELEQFGSPSVVVFNPGMFETKTLKGITLIHELYHAYDAARGFLDYRVVNDPRVERTEVREYRAVYFTNQVRKELNVPLRKQYKKSGNVGVFLDGKEVWVSSPCIKSSL